MRVTRKQLAAAIVKAQRALDEARNANASKEVIALREQQLKAAQGESFAAMLSDRINQMLR